MPSFFSAIRCDRLKTPSKSQIDEGGLKDDYKCCPSVILLLPLLPLSVVGPFFCENGQNSDLRQRDREENDNLIGGAANGATAWRSGATSPPSLHRRCSCTPLKISVGGQDRCVRYRTYDLAFASHSKCKVRRCLSVSNVTWTHTWRRHHTALPDKT